jgi:small subunit ribosomal protein S16
MVRIRLRRVGAKKQPSYRVVVTDSRAPRDGRFIEIVGTYNPRTEPETVRIQEDRALHWLTVGAQPSEAVMRLLVKQGTMARFERLKQGESLEALLAEAREQQQAAPEISPQTMEVPQAPEKAEPIPEEAEQETASGESDEEEVPEGGEAVEASEEEATTG